MATAVGALPATQARATGNLITMPFDGTVTLTVSPGDAFDRLGLSLTKPDSVSLCQPQCGAMSYADPVLFDAGTPIELSLLDATHGDVWSSTDPAHARITGSGSSLSIGWDDSLGDGDYNDVTVQLSFAAQSQQSLTPGVGSGSNPREGFGGGNPGESGFQICTTGDPVDCATGDFFENQTDVQLAGRGRPLTVSRSYNSQGAGTAGWFGYGWASTLDATATADANGDVTVAQSNGSTLLFTKSSPTAFTVSPRVTASAVRNADGTLTVTYKDQSNDTYSATGRLLTMSDRNGDSLTVGYDAAGAPSVITDSAGHAIHVQTSGGHITSVTDPAGRQTTYGYDGNGDLVTVTNNANQSTHFGYGSGHLLTTIASPSGRTVTNVYDAYHRVVRQTDPTGAVTTYGYSGAIDFGVGAGGGATRITDANGNVSVKVFQPNGELARTIDGFGFGSATPATTSYSYDLNSDTLTSQTDANGNTVSYTYDPRGNVLTKSHRSPTGATLIERWTYDAQNFITSYADAANRSTTWTRDAHGNVTRLHRTLAETGQAVDTTTTLDPTHPGDVTAITDPTGRTVHFTRNDEGQVVDTWDDLGRHTRSSYDADGLILSRTRPRGTASGANAADYTTTLTYDAVGRVTATQTPTGTSHVSYDLDGEAVDRTDSDGRTVHYTFDAAGRVQTVRQPNGATSSNTYDPAGRLVAQTNPLGHTTRYGYDALDRLITTTDPLSRTTTLSYYPNGWLKTSTDPDGRITAMTYNPDGTVSSKVYSDTTTLPAYFSYDALGRLTSVGANATHLTTFGYDSLGRLTSEARTDPGPVTRNARYEHDLAGRVTKQTYYTNEVTTRSYDDAGQLASVTDSSGGTSSFGYDPDGNVTSIIYGDGTTSTRTYDANDLMIKVVDKQGSANIFAEAYRRSPAGLVLAEGLPQGTTAPAVGYVSTGQAVTHDVNGRVTGTTTDTGTLPVGLESYGLDNADNITSRATATGVETTTYDSAEEPTVVSNPGSGTTSYTFNKEGERSGATLNPLATAGSTPPIPLKTSYTYDQAGHLTLFSGVPVQKLNQPTTQPVVATDVGFNYDGLGRLNGVMWDDSDPNRTGIAFDYNYDFVTGPNGMVIGQVATGGVGIYLHTDQLGSTRVLTVKGYPVASFKYDAYGKTTVTRPASVVGVSFNEEVTPFLYAGQYTDLTSGLIYMRARWYDPTTGSFLTRDPLQAVTGTPYAYAAGDPVDNKDPNGLIPCRPFVPISGLVLSGGIIFDLDPLPTTPTTAPGSASPFEDSGYWPLLTDDEKDFLVGVAEECVANGFVAGTIGTFAEPGGGTVLGFVAGCLEGGSVESVAGYLDLHDHQTAADVVRIGGALNDLKALFGHH